MTSAPETLEFQAETKALLRLVTHSLYTDKDIFLRELISNASDALDRLRFESLTSSDLLGGDNRFEIRLTVDRDARTLTISDSGIGMSRDEVIANIGTIAKSGTSQLRKILNEKGSAAEAAELIGQFGVGFYSAFMVADRVKLVTKKAGTQTAVEWESEGDGSYTIGEADKPERGTSITLHLKTADPENGLQDYTATWRLSSIVKKHSDFITYPILLKKDEDKPEGSTLNSTKPLWKRSPAEVKAEEYADFYKHISNDMTEPLKTIHFRAEGTFEYEALLYIPSKAPFDLYYAGSKGGLRLYAKKVMIMEEYDELLPHYLRFIRGVVDAADLPLNVSRQRLQQDHHTARVRKRLTVKVIDALTELLEKDHDKYLSLWKEFGRALKEGVASDYDNRSKLVPLLLFPSSNDPEKLTNLKDYRSRMPEGQDQIFYLTGESRSVVENSPHLEAVRAKGYEVLYMVEPIDELVLEHIHEFEGKKFKSAGKGSIDLGTDEEKAAIEGKQEQFKPLIEFLGKTLEEHVKQVRLSARLTSSPACLVVEEHEMSPMLDRLMRSHGGGPKVKRVMELNPTHELISRMQERLAANTDEAFLKSAADFLFGMALLSEGSELADPVRFNQAAAEVFKRAI